MNHLRRGLAPVTDAAWAQIDDEAQRSLRLFLGARKLVDVTGPLGWEADAVTAGLADSIDAESTGVEAALRQPVALTEFRTPFVMSLADMDTADRGNPAIDTDEVIAAARTAALTEDRLVFHGLGSAKCPGIVGATPQDFSIGYRHSEGDAVTLYLEESVAFQVLTPNAAVHLSRPE